MKWMVCFIIIVSQMFIPVGAITDHASSSILVDFDTNEILYEKDAKSKMYPASTTKIMTLIIIFEQLNQGNLQMDDQIVASAYASGMGGSQIFLKEGESLSVEELLKSIILASANDACVAFAEYISGTVDLFVAEMNTKAKDLELVNTNFVNCTGLHDDNHYTCAYDLALMARYLLSIGENRLLNYTRLKEDYIRDGNFWLINTNKLINKDKSITGLKTGYTSQAGYCLVTTATKNNQTMIGVVLNEPKSTVRNEEMYALIQYGFNLYKPHCLFEKETIIQTYEMSHLKEKCLELYSKEDIVIPIKKENTQVIDYEITLLDVSSFSKGEHVANLICQQKIYPLYAKNQGTKMSFFDLFKETFETLIYSSF